MSQGSLESCKDWYLYNPQTQERLGPMGTEDLKKYLFKFDAVSQSAALVWCPFWKDPRRGNETLALIGATPPPKDPTKTINVIYENSEPFAAKVYAVQRKFPRIQGALNVTLVANGQRVRTKTTSLSMGGMGLLTSVPNELFAPNCKAVLSSENAPHGIVASLKSATNRDPQAPVQCVRFEELRGWSLTTYIDWLQELEWKRP
jgi:hypothetical protein